MADDTDPIDPSVTRFASPSAVATSTTFEGIPDVGELVANKFVVERVIGVGGMGVVLAVRHPALGEMYALKCLRVEGAVVDVDAKRRFQREAQAAARIKSEHVARVLDFGELESGTPYILMEYLDGRDLDAIVDADGALPIDTAVEYLLQAATGVAEAHALGIVHRDLKPANLFLTHTLDGTPIVKVLDFGISKSLQGGALPNPSLTQTSSTFGSPAYMSPEQIRSAKKVDARSDVWSLGVILYELLCGARPFQGESGSAVLAAIAADPPASLRAQRPEVTVELEQIVLRCLEKDLKRRYQSVSELAVDLAPFRGRKSHVSVGRIVRLSTRPSFSNELTGEASSRALPAHATDAPVTTGARAASTPSRPSRRYGVLAGASAVAAVAAVAVYLVFVRGPASPDKVPVPAAAATTLRERSSGSAEATSPPPSSSQPVAAGSAAAAPASLGAATSASTAHVRPAQHASGRAHGGPPSPSKPTAPLPNASTRPSPPSAVTPIPPSRDPFEDSH